MQSKASGKCLDIGGSAPGADGPAIVQQPMQPAAMSQRWTLQGRADGSAMLINMAANMPLHPGDSSGNDGAPICLTGQAGDPTIWWKLV
ncbi:RICIN domain-containing protein [Nocardia seriolae]|uniref:RICIN domain-containing protein n=1 Tax=Nocardia seriolae TaxID=37332 RepID=UPI002E314753|nr:RICIN domain-containing protein [Nocardia seriolae]